MVQVFWTICAFTAAWSSLGVATWAPGSEPWIARARAARTLRSRLERAVLAAAYLQVLVVNGVREVFVNLHDYYPCPCVHSFPTVHNPAVFRVLETEDSIAIAVLGAAVVALVFRRWRRSSGPARRALNPLWFAGMPPDSDDNRRVLAVITYLRTPA